MDLAGHHSNPSGPLRALLEGSSEGRRQVDPAQSASHRDSIKPADPSVGPKHRRHDWVQEAVIRVFELHEGPMQAREVHAAAEELLGESVRWGSVKACLAANVAGSSPRFVRVGRGRYAICSPRVEPTRDLL